MFYIIGLGNPGEEYNNSRHNTGRMAVLKLHKDLNLKDFEFNKKANALISEGKIGPAVAKTKAGKEEKVMLILPETFMNKSGQAVSYFVPTRKAVGKPTKSVGFKPKGLENLIIIHDDLDLPIGTLKISYNKGLGGHRGLDSVAKAVKTLEFVRIRVGISPATPKGKAKKPGANLPPKKAGEAVVDFILGKFKPSETEIMKKVFKKASEAIQTLVVDGRDRAMNIFN